MRRLEHILWSAKPAWYECGMFVDGGGAGMTSAIMNPLHAEEMTAIGGRQCDEWL